MLRRGLCLLDLRSALPFPIRAVRMGTKKGSEGCLRSPESVFVFGLLGRVRLQAARRQTVGLFDPVGVDHVDGLPRTHLHTLYAANTVGETNLAELPVSI